MNEEQFAEMLRKAQPEAPPAPSHEWQVIQARSSGAAKTAPAWRSWFLAGSGALAIASLALFISPAAPLLQTQASSTLNASPTPALSEADELETYLSESLASLGGYEEASFEEYAF